MPTYKTWVCGPHAYLKDIGDFSTLPKAKLAVKQWSGEWEITEDGLHRLIFVGEPLVFYIREIPD